MKTRGETLYINMPLFAVKLYDNLTSIKGVNKSFEEIAHFIGDILTDGNVLDIGTGPGRLLSEISKQAPKLKFFGLDISTAMIDLAKQNLASVPDVDLRVGNINQTDFQDNFFDCIVSTGSFYNWDNPVQGLNEIFRILKPDKTAYIYDSYKDFDIKAFHTRLNQNLKGYNFFRKTISKYFLQRQLRMTYQLDEYKEILGQTKFKDNYSIEPIDLGNLSIYVRLELKKSHL
jgi:ubiquinone/menaquinone biosynthesis C-methylase UbiE